MELRDYIKILSRSWLVIVGVTILFGAAGYFQAKRQKPSFQAVTTFIVANRPQSTNQAVYGFDNFYTIQAASLLVESLNGIATSPNTVIDVYTKVGEPLPTTDTRKLAKVFHTQRPSATATSLAVSVKHQNENAAKLLIDELKNLVLSNVESQQKQGTLSDSFVISASDTDVVASKSNPTQTAVTAALVGAILAAAGTLLRGYLR